MSISRIEQMVAMAPVAQAKVLKEDWALIETTGIPDGSGGVVEGTQEVFFLHGSRLKYPAVYAGEIVVRDAPQPGQLIAPSASDELVVLATAPAQAGGRYRQATLVFFRKDLEKAMASAQKARETLAAKAVEEEKRQSQRDSDMLRAQHKGQGKGKKQRVA